MKGVLRKITASILLILFAVTAVTFILPSKSIAASSAQDEIKDYEIKVDVNEDGSLNMFYKITWHVISNGSEGPLDWVEIGIPNRNVDNILWDTSVIKRAEYFNDAGGDYIRIDFNRGYEDGEEVTFEYYFTQYNVFTKRDDFVSYEFTPGWFDDIPVDNLTVRWNGENVLSAGVETGAELIDGYYTWNRSLAPGERLTLNVVYDKDAYNFVRRNVNTPTPMPQQPKSLADKIIFPLFWGSLLIVPLIPCAIVIAKGGGGGYNSDGYSGGGDSGGSSSCACACACAGGGRAGCSSKDFYGTKLESARVRARLKKEIQDDQSEII